MRERKNRIGDVVQFRRGLNDLEGTIREDRGPLGNGGRHLYRIEFLSDTIYPELWNIELPAEDFKLIKPAA